MLWAEWRLPPIAKKCQIASDSAELSRIGNKKAKSDKTLYLLRVLPLF